MLGLQLMTAGTRPSAKRVPARHSSPRLMLRYPRRVQMFHAIYAPAEWPRIRGCIALCPLLSSGLCQPTGRKVTPINRSGLYRAVRSSRGPRETGSIVYGQLCRVWRDGTDRFGREP